MPEDDRGHHGGDVRSGLERCGGGSARSAREHPRKQLTAKEHELIIDERPLPD